MSAHDAFSDSSLEAMLRRRADRTEPIGLAADVHAALDTVAVPIRGPIPGWRESASPVAPTRRATWILLAASLLLALVGAALVAGLWRDDPLPPRVITGIDTLNAEGSYARVLVDGLGAYWAVGGGTLTRFEPGGDRRTWTIADDMRFGGIPGPQWGWRVAAARAGGVWIEWQGSISRFDGERFRESIPVPAGWNPGELAQAPDGTLWAASDPGGVQWWDGSSWRASPAGRPAEGARSMVVTVDGDVWVINQAGVAMGASRLRNGAWTTYTIADAAPFTAEVVAIEAAPDGSILAASGREVARFDGDRWTALPAPPLRVAWVSAGADGSAWVAGIGVADESLVARLRDGAWTTYGLDQGLVGGQGPVLATADDVFIGTNRGLYRMQRERWAPAWPGVSVPATGAFSSARPPIVPVGADEAWAADERGAWHYRDGRWEGPLDPGWPGVRAAVAVAPDGSVWLPTGGGVAVLRDGAWQVPWRAAARALAVGSDGSIWAATADGLERRDALTGERTVVSGCRSPYWLEPAADATMYVGSYGSFAGGLYAVRGTTCDQLDPLGDARAYSVLGLDSGPGDVLVAILFDVPPEGTAWTGYIVRRERGTWSVLETSSATGMEAASLGFGSHVTVAPDGSAWWARDEGGIVRWDGSRWETVIPDVVVNGSFTFGPDGSLWFIGASGIQRIRAADLPAQ